MGDTEPCYEKVFDLLMGDTLIATAETYEQAGEMAVSLVLKEAIADKLKNRGGYSRPQETI